MPSGGIWPGVFLHHRQGMRRKYNYMFLKMFFLTSGRILMSYITRSAKQQALKHFFLTGENKMVKSVFSRVHRSVSFIRNIY